MFVLKTKTVRVGSQGVGDLGIFEGKLNYDYNKSNYIYNFPEMHIKFSATKLDQGYKLTYDVELHQK
jgi:hypothetical protein